MPRSNAVRADSGDDPAQLLYARIGAFLRDQRLEPNPTNFTFAYHVMAEPDGELAKSVDRLTDGGFRLTMRDIDELGATVDAERARPKGGTDLLVAQTQLQVEGFSDMVSAIRDEARDFGRDLAASADAIAQTQASGASGNVALDQLASVTAGMLKRISDSEARLAKANLEAQELRSKLEEAREDALRDPLTGLANRRAFEREVEGIDRDAPFVIAVCDVDHFKTVNDRFGHSIGDRVLRAIADALRATCDGHFVARYGGEEFAILLRCSLEQARAVIDDARHAIAVKRYRLRESDEPLGEVTISAGVSRSRAGEGASTVFHRADRLMYLAKGNGRNCIMVD
ncbi:GGDEF domain-containing protein [Sphingomonas japonica]|uniref:diguanylate cyclase n=1 Tax=Sphingomonas japonica TaxID=511662 RepID=A0ABX0U559_9SPHN|nr:GGDEF domain-containing protein [Sphingomonas japonica]NIJ23927.1 diguanylate cyclase [Sphingomonas japonica]